MNRGFSYSLIAYGLLIFLQLATGAYLFHHFYGWTESALSQSFFSPQLSWERYLESAIPHLLAVSGVSFILAHFLSFIEGLSLRRQIFLSMGLFWSGLFNIGSGAPTIFFGPNFVYLKLASFLVFQVFYFVVTFLILKSALSSLQDKALRF